MNKYFTFEEERDGLYSPEIILSGNRLATVDSVSEITGYSQDGISLSLGKLIVAFSGDGLEIESLDSGRIKVRGNIFSVSFSS